MSLLVLIHALHPQGRAGADGARGMPGEPGVKVKCFLSSHSCGCLACSTRPHQVLMGPGPSSLRME